MNIKFHNPENKGLAQLTPLVKNKLAKLNAHYPFIMKADVFFNTNINYKGVQKACEIKLKTSGPEFSVNCFEESFNKAIESTFKVLKFQLQSTLHFAVA